MKTEKLITGLIITAVGLLIAYFGYQSLQPDKIEQGMGVLKELSRSLGEEMPISYKKDKTGPVLTLIAGGIITVIGLRFIIKAGE